MTRDELIEAAMLDCYVPTDVQEYGEFQRASVVVDTAYHNGFRDGVRAVLKAIEVQGLAILLHDGSKLEAK
mgnify:FL=1